MFKPNCQIEKGHTKIPQYKFDILNTLVATNIEFREKTHDQTAVDK